MMICESTPMGVSCEGGNRSKVASDSMGERVPQRFAEVLPIAQAALEEPSEADAPVPEGESADAQVGEEASVSSDCPEPEQDQTGSENPETAAWAFAQIIPPAMQPRTEMDADVAQSCVSSVNGQAVESAQSAQGAAGQTAIVAPSAQDKSPQECQAIPSGPPELMQVPGDEEITSSAAGDGVLGDAAIATPIEVGGRPTMPQQAQEAVRAPDGQTPPARRPEQAAAEVASVPSAASTQTVAASPDAAEVGQAGDADDGQMPAMTDSLSAGAPDADAVMEVRGQDTPDAPTSTSEDKPGKAFGRVGSVSEESSSVVSDATTDGDASARSVRLERKALDRGSFSNDSQHSASERPEIVSGESVKTEPVQSSMKDVFATVAKDAPMALSGSPVSSGSESVTSSPRSSAQTPPQTQASADATVARPTVPSIGEQILDSVQASATRGDRQILVRLTPPELGTVLVRFQQQGDQLTGTLEVSNQDARREIEQALPQVARTLQEAGVQVRRLEVVASDQSERDPGREHSMQDPWSQHQGAGQGRDQSHTSPQTRWSQNWGEHAVAHRGASQAQQQAATAQDRLDLLL